MRQFVIDDVRQIAVSVCRENDEVAVLPTLIVAGDADSLAVVNRREFSKQCLVRNEQHFDGQVGKLNLLENERRSDQLMESFEFTYNTPGAFLSDRRLHDERVRLNLNPGQSQGERE